MLDGDLAVAVRYQPGEGRLPFVTAKGRNAVARQIVEVARAHGVQVHHDADLAQVLGKLEIGSPIPCAAFAAVAEILAYLYHLNKALGPEHESDRE